MFCVHKLIKKLYEIIDSEVCKFGVAPSLNPTHIKKTTPSCLPNFFNMCLLPLCYRKREYRYSDITDGSRQRRLLTEK